MTVSRAIDDTRPGRWFRAAVAFALVAAQGGLAAHFALVKHEYSPLTGGWVHVHRGSGSRPHVSAQGSRTAAVFAVDDDDDSSLDRCAVVGLRREAALPVEPSAALPVDHGLTSVIADARWAPASNPLFLLAPKQSPPA